MGLLQICYDDITAMETYLQKQVDLTYDNIIY